MNVAFIVRSTIFTQKGGDTIQVLKTAKYLERLGIHVDIRLAREKVVYSEYDLLHFFCLGRPADILHHLDNLDSSIPFVVSTIYVEYEEYDKIHRKGLAGRLLQLSPEVEYVKTIGRSILGGEKMPGKGYLWKGQKASIQKIIDRAACLLPNSENELRRLKIKFNINCSSAIIPNGIDHELFNVESTVERKARNILCVARIEGIKNQLNLIRAVADTDYSLTLIGNAAKNQPGYYAECRKEAGRNVNFIPHISQEEILPYYQSSKVHILPSWFETTGLSSLEAGALGCNIVISNRGDAPEYFKDAAFYCEPSDPESIRNAITQASLAPVDPLLKKKINDQYTWKRAAEKTAAAYQNVLTYANRNSRHKGHTQPVWGF